MYNPVRYTIFILLFLPLSAAAQDFIVEKAPFSSKLNDEFSPVQYRGGIVFCSNIRDNSLVGYTDEKNRLFRIFYVPGSDSSGFKKPILFSKELTSGFNDGPATFTPEGDMVYFSRNNSIDSRYKNVSDTSNKLGIYSARFVKGTWTEVRPFRYNDPGYNFCTPAISPDGTRLYFSSDMPGGFGGMDLYYSELGDSGWKRPVNMGTAVNTSGNETFPFAGIYGKVYFSSDGHKGFGMKDIYYTNQFGSGWVNPVHLDSVINSPYDDFGISVDTAFENGYFSSGRAGSDDIFIFRTPPVEFNECDTVRENKYCFTFYDEQRYLIDTLPVKYIWQFGGDTVTGTEVKYCFPGPGRYHIALTITDELTGDTISNRVSYEAELKDIEQGYIRCPETGTRGDPVFFDGREVNLNDFSVTDYLWDFGEGFRPGGATMENIFRKRGEYMVRMGLLGGKDSSGKQMKKCYMKKITIL